MGFINMETYIVLQDRLARYRTNHLLHLILSIFTAGMWVPMWLLVTLSNAIERYRIIRKLNKLAGV